MNIHAQWRKAQPCKNCHNDTLFIKKKESLGLMFLQGIPQEIRQQASSAAVVCHTCGQRFCQRCTYKAGEALKLSQLACPNCQGTDIRYEADRKKWWQLWL